MRTLCAALLVGLACAAATADDPKKDPPKKPEPKLKIGDPAPPLKATKWLQGAEVKGFAAGKVYVVEFWATWCGPCLMMMPHMGELNAEYKEKGVTFIAYSAKDPNNSQEKVAAMVEKRGPKLGYTFAFAEDRETYDAWMKAAGQGGIPCSFVVDKSGKVAWIGHPLYLDIVLPKVMDGTWKGAADAAEIDKIDAEFDKVYGTFGGDPEAGLKALAEFEAKYPAVKDVYFRGPKLELMLKAKKYDEAKAAAEAIIDKAVKQEDPMILRIVSSILRSPAAKGRKDLLAVSVRAAEAGVKVSGDKDAMALLTLAEAYYAAGETDKAKETGQKALAAADSPAQKQYVERQLKTFDEAKKGDK